jgi:ketosteroid isomerase-like protein
MKVKLSTSVFIVFGFLCITNQVFTQQDIRELKNQVREISDITMQANIDCDAETLFAYYTDDVVSMPNYGPIIKGKNSLIEEYNKTREAGLIVHSMSSFILEIYDCGNIVLETGTYGISLTLPDMAFPVSDTGKYMTLYEKQTDGSLKIKAEIWNTDMNPWMSSK